MTEDFRYYPAHLAVGLALIVLQSTLLARLGGLNLLPVLIIHLATSRGFLTGEVLALCLGLLQDLYSGSWTGLHAGIYLGVYMSAALIHRRLNLTHPLHQLAVVFLALAANHLILNRAVGLLGPAGWDWLRIGLITAFSPVLFRLFGLVESCQVKLLHASAGERS